MTPSKLTKCFHHRVRLRPPARRFRGLTELRIMDDDWLVQEVEDKLGVRIRNTRTDQIAVLAFNQIRDYTPDPKREFDGLRHGFLELKVQVFLRGPDVVIEPQPRAVKRAIPPPAPAAVVAKPKPKRKAR